MRLLSKQPEQRPTAAEVAAWFTGPGWRATHLTEDAPLTKTARLPIAHLPEPERPTNSWGRHVLIAAAAAAAVVIAGVVGVAIASGEDKPASPPTVPTSAPPAISTSPQPSDENSSSSATQAPVKTKKAGKKKPPKHKDGKSKP